MTSSSNPENAWREEKINVLTWELNVIENEIKEISKPDSAIPSFRYTSAPATQLAIRERDRLQQAQNQNIAKLKKLQSLHDKRETLKKELYSLLKEIAIEKENNARTRRLQQESKQKEILKQAKITYEFESIKRQSYLEEQKQFVHERIAKMDKKRREKETCLKSISTLL